MAAVELPSCAKKSSLMRGKIPVLERTLGNAIENVNPTFSTYYRTILQGKKSIIKTEKFVNYIDEEEQAFKSPVMTWSQSMPARVFSPPSPSTLKLYVFKPCRLEDSAPMMPSLRLDMSEKDYQEPRRDRDKNWLQEDVTGNEGILAETHDPELKLAKQTIQDLVSDVYKYGNAKSIPPLYWSHSFQQLMRKTKLFRGFRLISETRCVVDVYGLGINGRIFSEGSTSGRLLIIECYSIWNSQKYVLVLTGQQLRSFFAGHPAFIKAGHKMDVVQYIVDSLYFTYTVTVPPDAQPEIPLAEESPTTAVDASARLDEPQSKADPSPSNHVATEDGEVADGAIKTTFVPIHRPKSGPPPNIVETVEHTQRFRLLPKKYPNNIAELVDLITKPKASPAVDEFNPESSFAVPVITQSLFIGHERRESAVVVRRREEEFKRRLLEEEEARKLAAWLAIQKRKRGLEFTYAIRGGPRLVVVTAYRLPSRPVVVRFLGHVIGECLVLRLTTRLSDLQNLFRIELHYLKWTPQQINSVIRRAMKEMTISYSDIVDGQEMCLKLRETKGTMEQARRMNGCADLAEVNAWRRAWYDQVMLDHTTKTPDEIEEMLIPKKSKKKKKNTEELSIKQLTMRQRKRNIAHNPPYVSTASRRSDYIMVDFDRLLLYDFDVHMTPSNPLYRPFRYQLSHAFGALSDRMIHTQLPVARSRRDVGRGQLLAAKTRKVNGVYCRYAFRLHSKVIPCKRGMSGMDDIPSWYVPPPKPERNRRRPTTSSSASGRGRSADGDENSESMTLTSANDDHDDKSVNTTDTFDTMDEEQKLAAAAAAAVEAKNLIFASYAVGFQLELEIYIPMECKVANNVEIPANTIYRVLFSKSDFFQLIGDEVWAHDLCKVAYASFYKFATKEEIQAMEDSWEKAARYLMDKCLWVVTTIPQLEESKDVSQEGGVQLATGADQVIENNPVVTTTAVGLETNDTQLPQQSVVAPAPLITDDVSQAPQTVIDDPIPSTEVTDGLGISQLTIAESDSAAITEEQAPPSQPTSTGIRTTTGVPKATMELARRLLRIEGSVISQQPEQSRVEVEARKTDEEVLPTTLSGQVGKAVMHQAIPSWSLLVFSRALVINGEANPNTSKLLQVQCIDYYVTYFYFIASQ